MMARVTCPWCGHGKMHYGEEADYCGEVRTDVFSCRGCGSAYGVEEMEEEAAGDALSLAEIHRAAAEADE